ncbi:MAG: lactonase family protein [Oscillospiraceae bacterium]
MMAVEFYTGSYGHTGEESIVRFRADFDAGSLTKTMVSTAAECPSYLLLHPNRRVLYAVRELTEEGALCTFAAGGDSLRLLSTLPTRGKDPCYLSLDDSSTFLFAVNYSSGSFCVYRLDETGLPLEMTDHVTHTGSGPNKTRQESPHPHCAVHAHGAVFVCDLGTDRVFRYTLDRETGKVTGSWSIPMPPGSGPRHLLVSPVVKDILYVVGELASKVYVLRLQEQGARLLQELSTLPEGFSGSNIAAALKASEDGRTLFVSNRGDDSIAVFRILPDGTLEKKNVCKTGGRVPRDFSVFGEHLVVANQDSSLLTVLRYDSAHFLLTPCEMSAALIRPTFIAQAAPVP